MRVISILVLAASLVGCLEAGLVPPGSECPPGSEWVDGECVPACDPECGPGETCNPETGLCEETGSRDGSTDAEAPDGPDPDGAVDGSAS